MRLLTNHSVQEFWMQGVREEDPGEGRMSHDGTGHKGHVDVEVTDFPKLGGQR